MTDDALLSVRSLRKTYRMRGGAELHAVSDVSFDVGRGQSLAVVGESGSGKTTCARMIAGLESPTSGEIVIDGRSYGAGGRRVRTPERRARARVVQMVFQDPYQSLDRRQTVDACLHEVFDLHFDHSRAEVRRRTAALLELVGLSAHHGRSRPHLLSGGQRQRVAIARALVPDPALLILDEAVSALDVSIQAQVLNVLMDAQASTGVAFLFISHDLGVVRHIAESVVVMHDGAVVEAGATLDVLDRPAAAYTQRLVASVPRPGWKPRRRRPAPPVTTDPGGRVR